MLLRTATSDAQPAGRLRPAWRGRWALAPLILSLVLMPAPGDAGPTWPATRGEDFVLRVGEAADLAEDRLELCFSGVRSDSRCPEGVQCFWEGDAVVALEARISGGEARSIELHTAGGARWPRDARVDGLLVQLVRLEPGARRGGLRSEEYRLTLRVTRAAGH